ncbi:MAG: ComF family protein [Amoebophilaceae bacterium]|nr:ComF family protein [Amoebophilaceae bacterium]
MDIKSFLANLLDFIFPPICSGCKNKLVQGELFICTICLHSFPKTDYPDLRDNPITHRFIPAIPITYGLALYKLKKQSLLEQVLFAMKYKNQPKIGRFLAMQCGNIWHNDGWVETIDAIIPIPLHKKRLQQRGYNQSDFFAQGLSAALHIPIDLTCVKRIRNTPSQTKEKKETRITNLKDAFTIPQPNLILDKHLLLVDDILTTGATLASCAKVLLEQGAKQVSVAAIAVVEDV